MDQVGDFKRENLSFHSRQMLPYRCCQHGRAPCRANLEMSNVIGVLHLHREANSVLRVTIDRPLF